MSRRGQNSYERKRKDFEPLERWSREVTALEAVVRGELGLSPEHPPAAGELALEVVRLADPFAMTGIDVVIPGTRTDLARAWMQARLKGRGATVEDRIALAHEIAPAPDEHLTPVNDRKKIRWRSHNKPQDRITEAAKRFFGNDN